jgi:hypothetical protein
MGGSGGCEPLKTISRFRPQKTKKERKAVDVADVERITNEGWKVRKKRTDGRTKETKCEIYTTTYYSIFTSSPCSEKYVQ